MLQLSAANDAAVSRRPRAWLLAQVGGHLERRTGVKRCVSARSGKVVAVSIGRVVALGPRVQIYYQLKEEE